MSRRAPPSATPPGGDDEVLDPAALEALPIFPLANCVLLPGGLLPLHVFEPRYRELARDCLRGHRALAIARLRPGFEPDYHGRPPVCTRAGVGTILASEELADGRFMLVLRGVGRIEIDHELAPTRAYRQVRARLLEDRVLADPDHIAAPYRQLIQLCDHLAGVLDQGGEQLRDLVRRTARPGACADAVAAAIVHDPDERQRLLETLCPCERVTRTIALVGALICELAPCEGDVN